jgi:hypothetical protein
VEPTLTAMACMGTSEGASLPTARRARTSGLWVAPRDGIPGDGVGTRPHRLRAGTSRPLPYTRRRRTNTHVPATFIPPSVRFACGCAVCSRSAHINTDCANQPGPQNAGILNINANSAAGGRERAPSGEFPPHHDAAARCIEQHIH